MESSREQFQPVVPSAAKAAREDRPEQAGMLTSASASFRLQEASPACGQCPQSPERHMGISHAFLASTFTHV